MSNGMLLDCVLLNYGQKKKKNHLNQMVTSSKEFVTYDVIWLGGPWAFAFIGNLLSLGVYAVQQSMLSSCL